MGEGDGSSQGVRIQSGSERSISPSPEPDLLPSLGREIHVTDHALIASHVSDELEFSALSGTPFEWTDENFNNCPEGQGTCSRPGNNSPYPWYHAGPVVVHISRVPDGEDVRTYDGAGEWVKM